MAQRIGRGLSRRFELRKLLVAGALLAAHNAHAQLAVFQSQPVTTATVGKPYVYEVEATTAGSGSVKITAPNGLPSWLSLKTQGNGTATLSGTPTAANPATVVLRAEDSTCTRVPIPCTAQQFTIIVSGASAPPPTPEPPTPVPPTPVPPTPVPNVPPVVVPPGLPDQSIDENQTLSLNVAAQFTDPDRDPLTFTVSGLPAGFALAAGVISGVATLTTANNSPYNVTVTAADGRGGSVSDTFVLSVKALARFDLTLNGITATPAPAVSGTPVSWVVTVGNAGPSPSGSADLTLEFTGTPITFTTNPCTLTALSDRQRLACAVGPIANGATQTVTLTGSAAQPADVYVSALVATSVVPGDSNTGNNAAGLSLNVAQTIVADPAQSIGVGAGAIAAGDLNGDAFADSVIVKSGDAPSMLLDVESPGTINAALVKPGDARRGLASLPLAFGTGNVGADVALADFDNDQDLDVVIANGAGAASVVLRNDGKAVLTQLAALGDAARVDRAVAVADMNGDGFSDVVIASANANSLYTNQNGNAFVATALPTSGGVGAIDVLLVDVVGSPLPDLIFVYANGPVVRHENLGAGTFGAAVTIDAGPVSAAASADFNRDGHADLVLARSGAAPSGAPSNPVYLSNGAGGLVAGPVLGATPTAAVLTGDVDGDGASDVVAINETGAHRVFLGDGNGSFKLTPNVLVSRGATRGVLAPLARLKRPDLVLVGPSAVHVFFNDGHGNFGLGDTTRPVIQLNGTPEVILEVGDAYTDPGATATDDVDGPLTPSMTNAVNTAVVGTYNVTFAAVDSAGNAATPVVRTVRVNVRAGDGGGGGGAAGSSLLLLLSAALVLNWLARSRSRRTDPCGSVAPPGPPV